MTRIPNNTVNKVEYAPIVYCDFDKTSNMFTFSVADGGPIIVSENREQGKSKMINALKFACVVKNLHEVNSATRHDSEISWLMINESKLEYVYRKE